MAETKPKDPPTETPAAAAPAVEDNLPRGKVRVKFTTSVAGVRFSYGPQTPPVVMDRKECQGYLDRGVAYEVDPLGLPKPIEHATVAAAPETATKPKRQTTARDKPATPAGEGKGGKGGAPPKK